MTIYKRFFGSGELCSKHQTPNENCELCNGSGYFHVNNINPDIFTSKDCKIFMDLLSLSNDTNITSKTLRKYSKINLKRKRMCKKFDKYYYRYISDKVCHAYWSYLTIKPLMLVFKKQLDWNFGSIEPMDGTPVGELYFFDPIKTDLL